MLHWPKKSLVMPFYYINFDQNGPPYKRDHVRELLTPGKRLLVREECMEFAKLGRELGLCPRLRGPSGSPQAWFVRFMSHGPNGVNLRAGLNAQRRVTAMRID